MNWKQLLTDEIRYTSAVTKGLLNFVDDTDLEWKPDDQNNWMTTGQLLYHITNACGAPIRGFVTGDWGLPQGADVADLSPDEMLPPAEKMPAVKSVAEARKLLEEDKQLALKMVDACKEEDLVNYISTAPWDASEMILGRRLLQMVSHLVHHKVQLFCYLKLQGKQVTTAHLWGA